MLFFLLNSFRAKTRRMSIVLSRLDMKELTYIISIEVNLLKK